MNSGSSFPAPPTGTVLLLLAPRQEKCSVGEASLNVNPGLRGIRIVGDPQRSLAWLKEPEPRNRKPSKTFLMEDKLPHLGPVYSGEGKP